MSIGKRITELRENRKKFEFANGLGITPDYLRMLETGEKSPGKTLIKLLCHKFNVNKEWLVYGKGEKYYKRDVLTENCGQKENIELYKIDIYKPNEKNTSLLSKSNIASSTFLPVKFHLNGIIAVEVTGKAMEPSFNEGSIVGVDTSRQSTEDGKIYVFEIDNIGIVLRRAFMTPDGVVLKADNTLFPDITLINETKVLGMVVWSLQHS